MCKGRGWGAQLAKGKRGGVGGGEFAQRAEISQAE